MGFQGQVGHLSPERGQPLPLHCPEQTELLQCSHQGFIRWGSHEVKPQDIGDPQGQQLEDH